MLPFIFGILGLIVGSFLNVVILRYGEKGIDGRSVCPHCHRTLTAVDLVPVFSYLFLRGTCRTCRAPISLQYPLVEAATAVLFAFLAAAGVPLSALALSCASAALLVCIFVYDLYHTIIPDLWVWLFAACALILSLLVRPTESSLMFMLLSGPIAALPIFVLWAASRGAWMGFGDVKLSLGIGWLLPQQLYLYGLVAVPAGFIAVWFAFLIGAVVSVCILLPLPYLAVMLGITRLEVRKEGFTMKSEVPFGPFLIASTLLVWFALLFGFSVPFIT